jgi:hypothetical protein
MMDYYYDGLYSDSAYQQRGRKTVYWSVYRATSGHFDWEPHG